MARRSGSCAASAVIDQVGHGQASTPRHIARRLVDGSCLELVRCVRRRRVRRAAQSVRQPVALRSCRKCSRESGASWRCLRLPATGVHSTCSIGSRPSPASPAGRSPARCRWPAASGPARPGSPRPADSARRRRAAFSAISASKRRRCSRDRSARRSRWPAPRRRHRARTARPRADRRLGPGQRRLGDRIFARMRGAAEAELRLDLLDQHAAEDVGPGVVAATRMPAPAAAAASASRSARRRRRAWPADRCRRNASNASATVRRSGVGERIGSAAAEVQRRRAGGLGGEAQQRRAVLHQPLVGLARRGTIPAS